MEVRPVVALEVNRLGRVYQPHCALCALRRLDDFQRLRFRSGGESAKILLNNGHDLLGLYIANDGHHHIGRHVVLVEELLRVSGREAGDFRRIPNTFVVIGMHHERRSLELLDQPPDRA